MFRFKTLVLAGLLLTAPLFSSFANAFTASVTATGTAVITLTNDDESIMLGGDEGTISFHVTEFNPNVALPERRPPSQVLTGVKNVVINARGGENMVSVNFLNIEGYLTVRSGNSNDTIELYRVFAGGNLSIVTGNGDDEVFVARSAVNGFSTISTTSGDDLVDIRNFTGEQRLRLLTGLGDDDVFIGQPLLLIVKRVIGSLDVEWQPIPDEPPPNAVWRPEFIHTVDLGSSTTINTSSGDDIVRMGRVSVGGLLSVLTGAGADKVVFSGNLFRDRVSVNGGAHDDDVTAVRNQFEGATVFKGASGRGDIYRDDESNLFMSTSVNTSFEEFSGPLEEMMPLDLY